MDEKPLPITFKVNMVAYPSYNAMMTIAQTREIIESGNYTIEFIMPLGDEPVIIIKPK